jgi:uncharacterized protein YecE (DUF72 family)
MARQVWIGTSGWTYDGWRGPFYPAEVPKTRWLAHYGERFRTAEINNSFYRTPSLEAVRAWRDAVPHDFVFAWKASKFITHWKRLGPTSRSSIELMVTRLKVLAPKIGPVLFQLPARFKADRARLASFLKLLPRRYQYAFEFRDPSWYDAGILQLLRDAGVSLCLSDHHDAPAPWEVTAQHVYVRGHGPGGDYRGRYRTQTLRKWSDGFARWQKRGHAIYCYFDNDQKSAAPLDAASLEALVDAKPLPRAKAAARRSR